MLNWMSCVFSATFSTGRRIGLSPLKRVVAGSSPAFGTRRRSSSAVEHVSRFVSYPSHWPYTRTSAGRRLWVIGHRRLAVQIRPRAFARVAQSGRATMLSRSLLARCFRLLCSGILMGRSCGLSHVIGSNPIYPARRGSSSTVEQPPQGVFHGAPCPSKFSSGMNRDDSTATPTPEAVWQTRSTNPNLQTLKSPANVAKDSRPKPG